MPDNFDFNKMSDEELAAIAGSGGQQKEPNISSMSDEELQRIAGSSQEQPSGGIGETAAAALRGVRESIPFGQDIGAAATTYLGNPLTGQKPTGDFEAEKRRQMERDIELSKEHPAAYGAGTVAGIGAQLLAPEVGLVKAGMGLPARVAAGSAEGALYGLGQGVTPEERLSGAGTGALFGAGATGLVGAAEKGLSAAKGAAQRLTSGAAGDAERAIQGAIETDVRRGTDRLTQEEIEDAVRRGQPILPVDVGGHTLSGELRKATNVSPEAEATVYAPLKQRNLEQQSRYERHMQDLMGHDLNAAGMQEDLREVARGINRPAYRAAYDAPGAQNIWNEDLAKLVQAPAVKSAIEPAMIKAANRAVLGEAPEIASPFVVDAAGNVRMEAGKNHPLEFWDNVKQAMDDKINTMKRSGDSSWVDINKIKNKLVETLDKTVPEYSKARSGAAAMFGADNAFDAGLSFLGTKSTLNSAKLKKAVDAMTSNEREVFAHGVAADMLAKIRNRKERSDISKMFDSPEERQKISMALGPEKADQFEAFHRVENIMDRAYQAVVSNSTTAKQYLRTEDKGLGKKIMGRLPYLGGEAGLAGVLSHSASMAFLPVLLDVGGVTLKHVSDKRSMAALEQLGAKLVSPDPAVRQEVINMIASKPSAMAKLRNVETSLRRLAATEGVSRREERASGGKVYPAKRLTALERAARRAYNDIANESKPIMDMPDEHVAHALNLNKDK